MLCNIYIYCSLGVYFLCKQWGWLNNPSHNPQHPWCYPCEVSYPSYVMHIICQVLFDTVLCLFFYFLIIEKELNLCIQNKITSILFATAKYMYIRLLLLNICTFVYLYYLYWTVLKRQFLYLLLKQICWFKKSISCYSAPFLFKRKYDFYPPNYISISAVYTKQ